MHVGVCAFFPCVFDRACLVLFVTVAFVFVFALAIEFVCCTAVLRRLCAYGCIFVIVLLHARVLACLARLRVLLCAYEHLCTQAGASALMRQALCPVRPLFGMCVRLAGWLSFDRGPDFAPGCFSACLSGRACISWT